MTKSGPETRLVKKMREAGAAEYGARLVLTKYHGGPYSEDGVSDLLGTLDGVMLAIEVKAAQSYGNSVERAIIDGPTVKQRAYIRRVNAAGGIGVVVASLEQFEAVLAVAAHYASTHERLEFPWMSRVMAADLIICTCLPNGECDYVVNPDEGCYYCRTADPDLPCPNND